MSCLHTLQATTLRFLHGECPLAGRWERIGDIFSGCVIQIAPGVSSPGNLAGKISVCPASMKRFGWLENDLKWKPIERTGVNTYRIGDLHKTWDSSRECVLSCSYVEARLFFIRVDTVVVATASNQQKWRRISG